MAARVLIANDIAAERIVLKAQLTGAAHAIEVADTPDALRKAVAQAAPDLVLLTETLAGASGLDLCRELKQRAGGAGLPVVLLGRRVDRAAAAAAGADALLPRLPEPAFLAARIRNLLRRRATEREIDRTAASIPGLFFAEPQPGFRRPARIALLAPSLAEGLTWRNALARRLRDPIAVIDPAQALAALNREPAPDAVILAEQPDRPGEAIRLLSELSCGGETFRAATILVQTAPDLDRAVMALDLGISDLVTRFDADELAAILRRELARKARADQRRAALEDGLRLAAIDPLTGLFNRRYAQSELQRIAANAPAHGESFGVLVLDLDRFKRINDRFGHAAGDAVLTEVARRMSACLRTGDFLARIGGEEFLAVVRNCDRLAAEQAAERLRRAVGDAPVPIPGRRTPVPITLSIGVSMGGGAGMPMEPAALIETADRGLYAAKAGGRNRVTMAGTAA